MAAGVPVVWTEALMALGTDDGHQQGSTAFGARVDTQSLAGDRIPAPTLNMLLHQQVNGLFSDGSTAGALLQCLVAQRAGNHLAILLEGVRTVVPRVGAVFGAETPSTQITCERQKVWW